MSDQITCPNCSRSIAKSDKFCSTCGQANRDLHIGFWDLLKDFLDNNFNFDTKLLVTLRYLLFKPGFLATEFSVGKRASYVAPLRLYLFISFVYFLALGLDFGGDPKDPSSESIVKLQQDGIVVSPGTVQHDSITQNYILYKTDPNDPEQIDSLLARMELGTTDFNRHWIRQIVRLTSPTEQKQLMQELLGNASIAMFFLMPLFALLLWLFARKPRPYFIDSLILSLHIHTFAFLSGTLLLLINVFVQSDLLTLALILGIMVYTGMSVKHVYPISWPRAMGRTVGISLSYMAIISITMLLLITISILLF